jgi:hypothetical protein
MLRSLAIVLAVALLPGALLGGGKKAPPLVVSFHLQAEPGDRATFPQLTAGKEVQFRKSAEFGTSNIVAFTPFPSDDQQSYGAVFQLDMIGSGRLQAVSGSQRGKLLLAVVNGQVRDAVLIDQEISDGMIVIWKRISLAEVKMTDQHLPRIGEDPKAWKKRLKDSSKQR